MSYRFRVLKIKKENSTRSCTKEDKTRIVMESLTTNITVLNYIENTISIQICPATGNRDS